jgi:hypothetical protein
MWGYLELCWERKHEHVLKGWIYPNEECGLRCLSNDLLNCLWRILINWQKLGNFGFWNVKCVISIKTCDFCEMKFWKRKEKKIARKLFLWRTWIKITQIKTYLKGRQIHLASKLNSKWI